MYIVGVLRRQEMSRGEEMVSGAQKIWCWAAAAASALSPVPLLCQCSPISLLVWLLSSSGLKAWKQNFLPPPNAHCTDTILHGLPRVEFYLGLEILNHRKLLNVTEVDSVTGGCTDGDWVGNCQTSGGISAPVENKGTGCSELHAVLLQQSNLKEAVKWLQCIKYL